MGKVSDIFGRKQTFLTCVALFTLGSFIAAIAPNIQILILARAIQAFGSGGFVPATMSVISDSFPESRQKMIGISISLFNIGGIIGPSIGAWLVSSFGWRSVFWFNVPFGIFSIIPVLILLKADKYKSSHIDFKGAGLLAVTLFGFMIGVSRIDLQNSPLEWLVMAALVIVGVVGLLLFLRHTHTDKEPIVDSHILRRQPFLSGNIYNLIFGASVFSFSSFIPLFITSAYAMTTYHSGIILGVRSIGNIIASIFASFTVTRWSYRKQIMTGTILISATTILMALQPQSFSIFGIIISDFTIMSVVCFLSGVALGIVSPALLNALVDMLPQRVSMISGLGSMFRQSGGAIFISVITVVVQSAENVQTGFLISFMIVGLLILACVPFIFKIPNRHSRTTDYPN